MGTLQQTQGQLLSLYKRIRRKFRRIKRLTVGYIRNMAAYKAYRKYRHHITGPLRMARAAILLEDHQEQKAQREQEAQEFAAQFLPLYLTQEPTPQHPEVQVYTLPLCGGSPVRVDYPGQFAGYQPIIRRPDERYLAEADTRRIGMRQVHLQYLIEPEPLPERIAVTQQDAEFLLDQKFPHQDPDQPEGDVTTKRPAVQKAG